jgi:quercetin dioxygenase-like cupin family protein
MHIGEIIHSLRSERKMTLLELSRRSGVALATLSRIENGKMTGTLKSHINIASALEISLPELCKNLAASKKQVEVKSKKERADVFVHDKNLTFEMLASKTTNKKMMPVMLKIAKGSSTRKEETKSNIEKFIYVIDGRVEANISDEKYNLSKGDTLYFESSVPHFFKNTGLGESRLLVVTSPPLL